jgi:hypothetical protein
MQRSTETTLVKDTLAHFAIDAKASWLTVQAFASAIVAVAAHSRQICDPGVVDNMDVRSRQHMESFRCH